MAEREISHEEQAGGVVDVDEALGQMDRVELVGWCISAVVGKCAVLGKAKLDRLFPLPPDLNAFLI